MQLKDMLRELCLAPGAAGQTGATDVAEKLLAPYCDRVERDVMGNLLGWRKGGDEALPLLLLEAHIDQVGFTVTGIEDNGLLRVAPMGGFDSRLLSAADVVVYGDKPYDGVFTLPADGKLPPVNERLIDTGSPAEEVKAHIPVGAAVTYRPHYTPLLGERVSATSLDDRSGVAVVLRCLQLLEGDTLPCRVAVAFAVQEEVGVRGAAPAAFALRPDAAVCTDVSFATMPQEDPNDCGELGKGPMIGIAPSLDAGFSQKLTVLAKEGEIPYQLEVMSFSTGTDADRVSISRCGVPTALLSIPQRYMHTQVEVVDLADVENTARLMAAFAREWRN